MDIAEVESIAAADEKRTGVPASDEAKNELAGMFENIEDYTYDDYIEGTKPYEHLYFYIDEPFKLEQKRIKMEAAARKQGVKNFTKLFKNYCLNRGGTVKGVNTTDFPDQPLTLRCGSYICDPYGVKTETETVCPHPIMPVQRLVNIDTGAEKVKIAFCKNRYWRTAIFERKTISSATKIVDLSDIGISVTSESAKALVKYFAKMEELNMDIIPEVECVTRMGWIKDGENLTFLPYAESVIFDGEMDYKKIYTSVKCKGNFEKWVNFVNENIRHGSLIARITFATSLASVLVKPLGCLPFFLHLWGGTGTGKTVLTMCAASIWANPTIGQYIQTFNKTFVGIERLAAFFNNLPLMLDELQIENDRKDFDRDIYMLTEGVGRTRGNKSGGIDITPTWRNCVITTGERPILTASSGGGAVNRVIEVECKTPFFKEPKAAARFLTENYGTFGKAFVAELKATGFEKAEKLLDGFYDQLVQNYGIAQKQAQSAALILTADKMATDMLFSDTPSITPEEISNFLKTETAISINPRAYEYVCEYVTANQNKFMGNAEYGEVWGVKDLDSVYILKNKFNQICDEGGYNAQSLLSWLSDRGLIRRTDKKHYAVVKRIGDISVRCIHMTLSGKGDEDYSDIDL